MLVPYPALLVHWKDPPSILIPDFIKFHQNQANFTRYIQILIPDFIWKYAMPQIPPEFKPRLTSLIDKFGTSEKWPRKPHRTSSENQGLESRKPDGFVNLVVNSHITMQNHHAIIR